MQANGGRYWELPEEELVHTEIPSPSSFDLVDESEVAHVFVPRLVSVAEPLPSGVDEPEVEP